MTTTYKVLGQSAPYTTNDTTLYTVPTGAQTVVSTLTITNTSSTSSTFQIFICKDGAPAMAGNALIWDAYIGARDMIPITIGITLEAGNTIVVCSGIADALTYQAFGSETV